jgi:hypothetical protein
VNKHTHTSHTHTSKQLEDHQAAHSTLQALASTPLLHTRVNPHSSKQSKAKQTTAPPTMRRISSSHCCWAFASLAAVCISMTATTSHALTLSMVASRPRGPNWFPKTASTPFARMPSLDSVSSSLVSQLAIVALKLRLARQESVDCQVAPLQPLDLMQGRVGPVTVTGTAWQSGLGLTCRAIQARVETCELDLKRLLSDRKLVLQVPALGQAQIVMDAQDFGNFMGHPLLKPPLISLQGPIEFIKSHVVINDKTVQFKIRHANQEWTCLLQRAGPTSRQRALIRVVPIDEAGLETAQALSRGLTDYFNQIVFELDGTFLAFGDLIVKEGPAPVVVLALDIRVRKFPSPGLAF